MRDGLIIVDHGSRVPDSNKMLETVASLFAARFAQDYSVVEPAHMEIAEPSIMTAYSKSVSRGATRIIILPFFLGPGKHWTQDIPRLAAEAAAPHPGTRFHVAQTLGIDELILELLNKRARFCVDHNCVCEVCENTPRCGFTIDGTVISVGESARPLVPSESATPTG